MKRRERLFTCTDVKEKLAARRLLEVMLDIELDRPEDEMDTEFIEQCLDALLKRIAPSRICLLRADRA